MKIRAYLLLLLFLADRHFWSWSGFCCGFFWLGVALLFLGLLIGNGALSSEFAEDEGADLLDDGLGGDAGDFGDNILQINALLLELVLNDVSQLEDGVEDGVEAGLALVLEVFGGEHLGFVKVGLFLGELDESFDVLLLGFLGLGLFAFLDGLDGVGGEFVSEVGQKGTISEVVQELGLGDLLVGGELGSLGLIFIGEVAGPFENVEVELKNPH